LAQAGGCLLISITKIIVRSRYRYLLRYAIPQDNGYRAGARSGISATEEGRGGLQVSDDWTLPTVVLIPPFLRGRGREHTESQVLPASGRRQGIVYSSPASYIWVGNSRDRNA